MCGIAGIFALKSGKQDLLTQAEAMGKSLDHRGPDSYGSWKSDDGKYAVAHRRLAVVDLSEEGAQPMHSASGRFVLAFNGEIYNHKVLRTELTQIGAFSNWRGHSDTEVLLAAIEAFGFEQALHKSRGMFAIALWDRENGVLNLARDRFGEKPLYYGWLDNQFVFASELKALRALRSSSLRVNPAAVSNMLRFGYIPSPLSIYDGIHKLPAGSRLVVDGRQVSSVPLRWWKTVDSSFKSFETDTLICDKKITSLETIEQLLGAAVSEQMVADVPLGAMLSGGIDSSLIAALMQDRSLGKINTFTIGFKENAYDESAYATDVSKHLGTNHHEIFVTAQDAMSIIPEIPVTFDEPFGDSSQLPSILLSRMTREHVTVCLTGDGADELFGGYNRYTWLEGLWQRLSWMPISMRTRLVSSLRLIPATKWNVIFSILEYAMPQADFPSNPGDKLHKFSHVFGANCKQNAFIEVISQWHGKLPLIEHIDNSHLLNNPVSWPVAQTFPEQMMLLDCLTYLPDDILTKVDRASMASGLEARAPFLDERVASFALKLPIDQKIMNGSGKIILRDLLKKYLPADVFQRPKQGFSVPIEYWLRGPLRDWSEDLLSKNSLDESGLLDPMPIMKLWRKHLSGQNAHHALWNVLMFQAWIRNQ